MVALTDGKDRQSTVDAIEPSPRKFKILMIHGYTQSGPLFHSKTRAIEKMLNKYFSSESTVHGNNGIFHGYSGIQLIYPTGPFRLCPLNIPGYKAKFMDPDEESDLWGWWTRDMDSGLYGGLEQGLSTIARTIREHGGIDAVMGFSQGAAAASMVTSLLEPGRQQVFDDLRMKDKDVLPFPEDWRDLSTLCPNGLKFLVVYSGFLAAHPSYRAFFEPKIQTPSLHFIGSLDSVVEEVRTMALVKKCAVDKRTLIYHPGGHFVPNRKIMGGTLLTFIKKCLMEKKAEKTISDMEILF
ncbi:hypothetical protein K3495_g5313 [Podosphaera aphanis]|nr:hypothetical protein K3495_g5313 [Podosphaera aphanis]